MRRTVAGMVLLLAAVAAAKPVRFAIVGDRTGGHQDSVYEQVIAAVAKEQPEFVITVGDQIEGYTEDTAVLNTQWREYKGIVSVLAVPLHLTPGNHDITTDGQLASYATYVGRPYYSFDYRGMHVIVLDASRWEASDKLPQEQLDWLARDLAGTGKAKYTFVFFHKPFWDGTVTDGKPDTLHKLFVKYGVDAVFAGHYHQYFSGTYDGIKYTVVGSSGGESEPGPTGILYHWTLATVDDEKGIAIEPVLPGGERRKWDDVTVADMQAISRNYLAGLKFPKGAFVRSDLSVADTTIIVVTNSAGADSVNDTLRWEVPEGWRIEPATAAVALAPGERAELRLYAASQGSPYPAPQALLRLPYAAGKSSTVKRPLRVMRTARCVTARAAPKIDGVLGDKCWRRPVTQLLDAKGGPAKTDSTRFYFAYDSIDLYLAAVCFDPAVNTVKAQAQERDGAVFNDDCVGYFLQPDTSKGDIYQVYFNPAGVVFDQKIYVSEKGEINADPKWDLDCTTKTFLGEGFWSIEVKIPLPAELLKARPGDAWGLNFRRKQPGRKANADWQPVSYDPSTFGLLLFD